MPVTIKNGENSASIQRKVNKVQNALKEKYNDRKRRVLVATAGTVSFDKGKTALEIQQEIRNNW